MPKFLMGVIVLSLLLGAGYGLTTLQARSIPWDCADWQAFAHDDRPTAILESLAENRGKTLYCGVDQSDTFTKAETWEAGKDRNERDDTVYYGERGQFRGFIAAQEGYLTDGESGVTGVSIDRIFEFPREERRRTKRVKRMDIANDPVQFPINTYTSCGQVGGIICGPWGGESTNHGGSGGAITNARRNLIPSGHQVNWQTQARVIVSNIGQPNEQRTPAGFQSPSAAEWTELATAAAKSACRAEGYPQVTNVAIGRGYNGNNGHPTTVDYKGPYLGLLLSDDLHAAGNIWRYNMRQSRTWSATCKKVIRRTRK